MSVTGFLKAVIEGKGFGFITRDDGQADVFCHPRLLKNGSEQDMVVGTRFAFDVEMDEKTGKTKAVNVMITQPGNGSVPIGGCGGACSGTIREPCGDFKRGVCTRGDRCRYSHDVGGGGCISADTYGASACGGFSSGDNRYSPYGSGAPAGSGFGSCGGAPAFAGSAPVNCGFGDCGGAQACSGGALAYGGGAQAFSNPGLPAYCGGAQTFNGGAGPMCNGGAQAYSSGASAGASDGGGLGPGKLPLPQGWEEAIDQNSGRPYYCNRNTGESSWTPPPTSSTPPLPQGWEQVMDAASGKPYYWNRATNQTSWTPP